MQDHSDTMTRDSRSAAPAGRSRPSRQERQARVGILHNPNSPPRPPTRRAPLMGRWPSLRSSRRPKDQAVEDAALAVVARLEPSASGDRGTLPVRRDKDGSVQAIDLAGLMASVEGVGKGDGVRAPYAAAIRADGPEQAPLTPAPRKAAILRAEAWIDDADDPAEDQDALGAAFRDAATEPRPNAARARRLRGMWIVALGALIAFAVLVLLPAWGFLQAA